MIPEADDLSVGVKKASLSASCVARGEVQRALYMYGPKGLAKEKEAPKPWHLILVPETRRHHTALTRKLPTAPAP